MNNSIACQILYSCYFPIRLYLQKLNSNERRKKNETEMTVTKNKE
jgi:hypothetical protein